VGTIVRDVVYGDADNIRCALVIVLTGPILSIG
jgi:hypothetical protein